MYLVDKLANNLRFDEPRLQGGGGTGGGSTWGDRGGEGRRSLRAPKREPPSRDESWGSASDRDVSSDDENDRSVGFRSNGQLRNTLNKARTLCDRWRGGGGGGGGGNVATSGAAVSSPDCASLPGDLSPGGRLSRWFSVRRGSGHQYDVAAEPTPTKMPQLPEVDEDTVCGPVLSGLGTLSGLARWERRQAPPALPAPPPGLNPQQLKRRHIVAAIVHSENSYVATLQRLVNDYKKPLEESSPAILSSSKISTLFHRLPDILQCHTLFRIALADCVRAWDRDEKLGDVFVASFSKAIVLDIYSGFINNFSVAMDLAKMEAKRKSALADFLKVKQISAHDRLSFFGLMVKPVQRFPQFILFLQDLLKHTPQGHHDRMSLQLALTQLESLAEMLNERKREAEQSQAFREMLRHVSGKFAARPLTDGNRHLIREDNVTQLEFNQGGMITKTKCRRLLLLNDLVVCVSVAPRQSEEFGASERLSLKWMHPVAELEIVDSSASPTLSRILTAGLHRGGSLKSTGSAEGVGGSGTSGGGVDSLCGEMSALMHDYEVVSRISDLAGTLRGRYAELSQDSTKKILQQIQHSIQRKDEEMAWVDSCCLQVVAKNKSGKEETYTFQTENPNVKKDWITELRLAQLALDTNNSPGWEVLEQEQRSSTKMPLFVKAQPVYKSQHQTEVRCGCYYSVSLTPTTIGARAGSRRRKGPRGYLWVCTTDGASSHIAVLSQHAQHSGQLRDVGAFDLVETQVTAMEFVKGISEETLATGDSVWLGTDTRKIFLYAAAEPEKQDQISQTTVPAVIMQIKYHCDCVFVALGNGSILIYHRDTSGAWSLKDPISMTLGPDAVSCLLPINMSVYAACGKKVWVISGLTGEIQKSFSVQHEHVGSVNLMAHSGVGLWISLKNSSTICLYHTETFKHLQDINLASNVLRVMGNGSCGGKDCSSKTGGRSSVTVSALLACRGLLWVGTSAGIGLTIPLPRLEGVPIISGRVNISYHSHFGPITFLLALQPKTYNVNPYYNAQPVKDVVPAAPKESDVKESKDPETAKETDKTVEVNDKKENDKQKPEKQVSDSSAQSISAKIKHQLTSSPVVLRRRRSKDNEMSRLSKTLPRGLGAGAGGAIFCSTTSSQGSGDACDVYGLYNELIYVKDCEGETGTMGEPAYETLRRSDPELAAIPAKVSTLDRKLRMKVSRPRSLDLSNWSVDSRSSSLYTSSGSEESMALRGGLGRSISRNNSNASRTVQLSNGSADVVNITVNINNITSALNSGLANGNSLGVVPDNRFVSRSNSVAQDAMDKNKNKKNANGKNNLSNDSSKRTVITLMGGRGYVNWRQSCCSADRQKTTVPPALPRDPNKNDAHIVVWETKL